ncbi:MAG: acyl--CoA ligase, partial [candidate division Zixibacteria bacterium]|nr:acyl--CoA ligase [candidate division Zixibacteria bacterium]
MNIFDILCSSAQKYPKQIAAVHHESRISYKELYYQSKQVSNYIQNQNLEKGSRIGILFENSIEYIYLYFAVFGTGHIPVPLDTSLNSERLSYILSDCSANALIIQNKFLKHLPELLNEESKIRTIITDHKPQSGFSGVSVGLIQTIVSESIGETMQPNKNIPDPKDASDELAAIFYTSGSTGTPKGVMLSHKNLLSNTFSTIEYLKLNPDDSVLVILPFYYIYGNSLLLTHIASGGTIVIDNRFMYPEIILKTMDKEKVTGFSGVPSNFMILLNKSTFADKELKYLRYFTQAGGSMAPEIIRKLIKAFPEKEIYIMYGQTEASPRVTYLPPEQLENKIGSIGIPIPGIEITIVNKDGVEVPNGESGELVVSGDNVMLGYWNQDDDENQVVRDDNLYTGDLAKKD